MGNENKQDDVQVFVVGADKLTYSIVAGLLSSGNEVILLASGSNGTDTEIVDLMQEKAGSLHIIHKMPDEIPQQLIVCITREDVQEKVHLIQQLEQRVNPDAIIAINMEGITLAELQESSQVASRILGLNWSYPAQHTFFLEIIGNEFSGEQHVTFLAGIAKEKWGKDPYTVRSGFSVRARIMAAWAREAFYLVENDYASIESIDRACRNDAGYYLPFAGNFRYMDLMGTYAYGVVMQDLNPELSTASGVSRDLLADFQKYTEVNKDGEGKLFLSFSQEVRELIIKYSHEKIDR